MHLEIAGKNIELNNEGFLINLEDWNENVAILLAEREDIQLTKAHWEIIYLLRNFYQKFQHIPPLRIWIKYMANHLGAEKGISLYFYQLFPDSPLKRACKIAGLSKPRHCL